MMRNDSGSRFKKKKAVIEPEITQEMTDIAERKAKTREGKYMFCPVCLKYGPFTFFTDHMVTRHDDYLKKFNIDLKVFEYLEVLSNSDYLAREKFIHYNWPDQIEREFPKSDLSGINGKHYKVIEFAFHLLRKAHRYPAISDLIRPLTENGLLDQPKACDFVERCVDEGVLKTDGIFYEFVPSVYLMTKIFYTRRLRPS
jgi:hypothetical protein